MLENSTRRGAMTLSGALALAKSDSELLGRMMDSSIDRWHGMAQRNPEHSDRFQRFCEADMDEAKESLDSIKRWATAHA